jgi:pyridoxal phosphate enzyme, YggS family
MTVPPEILDALRARLEAVRERMTRAAERAGRRPEAVRLVAVTKGRPLAWALGLVLLGQRDLGENRPEEVPPRARALEAAGHPARWHMIGHYQRRKVRDTLSFLSWVHSVHSVALAERLDRRLEALGRPEPLPVLLQVNVSGEATKQGFAPEEAPAALERVAALPRLDVRGLMTMAPAGLPSADLRRVFAALRTLRDRLATRDRPLPELSMGMSGDFEEAILEGATMVRIGSLLFEGVPAPPGPGGGSVPGRGSVA